MTWSVVVRGARLGDELVSVRVEDGTITHVGARVPGADAAIDADGGAVIPGLHDHHLHLLAMAAARRSVPLGPPGVTDPASFDAALRAAASTAGDGWIRGVGYHEWEAGPLDRHRLDALAGARPVRVQHATGAMWVLSSTGLRATGLAALDHPGVERDDRGEPTGRCLGLDAELRAVVPPAPLDLGSVGRDLARRGITGVTDLTPTDDPGAVELIAAAVGRGDLPLDVSITGGLALPDGAAAGLGRGPVKLVAADHAVPDVEALAGAVETAHRRGRPVAIHCASLVGLVVAIAAWDVAGVMAGDRIEHGAVIPVELIERLRRLGPVVVTQPAFVRDRGDRYLGDVPTVEHGDLWRCGSLLAGGVGVAAGSDAPYGDADPWRAIAAAVERRTVGGAVLGPDERIPAVAALGLYLTAADDPAGPARRVAVGAPGRVCLLDRPLSAALAVPDEVVVRATIGPAGVSWSG